jgi:hypothetical protein
MTDAPERVRVNETRARQARRGLHVFWVLAISTALAGTAMVLAWAWRSGDLGSVRGSTIAPPGAAQTFNEAPPTAKQK